MDSGSAQSYSSDEEILWESGQYLLPSVSETLSLDSEQSMEQSAEQSAQGTSLEYSLGAYDGASYADMAYIFGVGACAGFGVAVCVALASWGVACIIKTFRKGAE